MSHLFTREIHDLATWGKVFCDVEAFAPLVREIYRREGFPVPERIENMTPGTNAVFCCGDTVVKIFVPEEAGFCSDADFAVEKAMLGYAHRCRVPTSDLLASGEVEDRYLFRYMILAFVEGNEAGDVLKSLSGEEKLRFGHEMRKLCDAMHQPVSGLLPDVDLKARGMHNFRLSGLPQPLQDDFRTRIAHLAWGESVIVHGDLTGENVLVRPDGTPVIIDFADSVSAPVWYENAALVLGLFHCDRDLVRGYFGETDVEEIVRETVDAIALHDFGANIVVDWAREQGIQIGEVETLDVVAEWLRRRLT